MRGAYNKWLTCAIVYLSHTQAWSLHMYGPISDDQSGFGRMHISQPQIAT